MTETARPAPPAVTALMDEVVLALSEYEGYPLDVDVDAERLGRYTRSQVQLVRSMLQDAVDQDVLLLWESDWFPHHVPPMPKGTWCPILHVWAACDHQRYTFALTFQ